MNEDQKFALQEIAQLTIDGIIEDCRSNGSDPIAALEGARMANVEFVRCTDEAIAALKKAGQAR